MSVMSAPTAVKALMCQGKKSISKIATARIVRKKKRIEKIIFKTLLKDRTFTGFRFSLINANRLTGLTVALNFS